jgi:DNA polymerase III alpha subunit/nucleotidyltransferase/DNA polymerase involved in DNA repair
MQMRTIVHMDADAFFASVEQAADARLRGKPIAVGGESRGIIASASYEARKFGVYTPMPTALARKLCPKLIVLPGDYSRYEDFSNWMFGYAYDFTPDVEKTSIDEGYFDLTANHQKPPGEIARIIRQAIAQRLKISVSEGIGSSKLISQIASKLNKPAAFHIVPSGQEVLFLEPLPNKWLPGIGPKTSLRLNSAGLATIGQVAGTPVELLELLLGGQAPAIRRFANGIDERQIIPASEPQKSYSKQETFGEDVTDEEYIEAVLRRMADHLFAQVREEGRSVRTLTVKVRYNDRDEGQRSESLREPTDLETEVYDFLRKLLRQAWSRRVSLRMVSLKLSNVYDGLFRSELSLAGNAKNFAARERLAATIDELRRNQGWSVVQRGHDLLLRDAPCDLVKERPKPVPPQVAGGFSVPQTSKSAVSRVSKPADRPPSWRARPTSPTTPGSTPSPPPALRIQVRMPAAPRSRPVPCVPLRVRSYYSFLDSALSPAAIVKLAAQHQQPAVALADTGNLHGAVEFAQAAKAAGLKPVFGVELCVNNSPLLLYVESATGYRNLNVLLSQKAEIGRDDGAVAAQQRQPMASERLRHLTDGLIAVSPNLSLAELFPGRFYELATQQTGRGKFPMVACPVIHHATPADRLKYDILQSIRTLTLLHQTHPEKRPDGRLHFRTPAEMTLACQANPEWLANTVEIAGRCQFEIPFGKPQFPAFVTPDGSAPRDFLHRLVHEGLRRRYRDRATDRRAQVEQELAIISAVGYEEYFLVVWNILQDCRRHGIEWITRGSAADSLVCYCLGISDVCPIRFGLYFRRFLNQERMALNKLPDIDVDFPHDRKDDVVDLIFAKYGREHCAVVGGFSTFQARSAFADVAKVLGVAEREVRRFTNHFPWGFGGGWVPDEPAPQGGAKLRELLAASPENRDLPLNEEPFKTALDMAEFLDGFPRNPKMHPCGVVLSRQPMRELTPTFISNKGYPTTHYDMDAVELIGLVKIDVLAQAGLAAMRDVKASLAGRGVAVDLPGLEPWQDPKVWQMIAGGGARAVHHIESPAMTGLCRQCHVRDIDTLIAIVSVIRPGAANEGKKLAFTRRYQGLEPVTHPDPSLATVLNDTFGLVVYEEHVLQICEAFAGLPPGRADVLRRALNKNKHAVIAEIQKEFFASAQARGHARERTEEVWRLVTGFAGYAFCKAHSTAYGVEAYQSAWLKCNYPAEFMAAVLTNGKGFYHPIVYVLESHRLGLKFLPPTVNEPGPQFAVHGPAAVGGFLVPQTSQSAVSRVSQPAGHPPSWRARPTSPTTSEGAALRVPLTLAKGLTDKTQARLLAERSRSAFASLADFFRRVKPSPEEMEAIIRAGGFDEFGQPRTRQFWEAQYLVQAYGHAAETGQGWLLPPASLEHFPEVVVREPTRRERLEAETELFGYAVSGHPLELFADVAWNTYCRVSELGRHVGETVVMCGLVVEQRTHHQITGEPMKFLTLADWTGMVETELFAQTYKSYGLATVRYPVLEVTAIVEPFENGRGFSLRVLRAGKPRVSADPAH